MKTETGRCPVERAGQAELGDDLSPSVRLRLLLAETLRLPVESIVDTLDMQASGTWDSLMHMELIAAIEETFDVELSADDIVLMTSVARIESVLRGKSIDL